MNNYTFKYYLVSKETGENVYGDRVWQVTIMAKDAIEASKKAVGAIGRAAPYGMEWRIDYDY